MCDDFAIYFDNYYFDDGYDDRDDDYDDDHKNIFGIVMRMVERKKFEWNVGLKRRNKNILLSITTFHQLWIGESWGETKQEDKMLEWWNLKQQ